MDKNELLKKLTGIYKDKEKWKKSIEYVAAQLTNDSVEVKAKALWILGEMGMKNSEEAAIYVDSIAQFLHDKEDILRERSLNALGRIGRTDINSIEPYWSDMFSFAEDNCPKVRLSFIWASENIASTYPDKYKNYMHIYADLLDDRNVRVRIEAPEMFRVIGKRKPDLCIPYFEKLRMMSENDSDKVVRIHSLGAIKATMSAKEK